MKSSEVSIKTRSTPASLSFKGQATKQETVKWSIELELSWVSKDLNGFYTAVLCPYNFCRVYKQYFVHSCSLFTQLLILTYAGSL